MTAQETRGTGFSEDGAGNGSGGPGLGARNWGAGDLQIDHTEPEEFM